MKLYQALKKKNLLVGEISELVYKVKNNNSIVKGNTRDYNVQELYEELIDKKQELTILKAAIQLANAPICQKIYHLSELKSTVDTLRKTSCNNGIVASRYGDVSTEYEAQWSQKAVDESIKTIRAEIGKLQDELEEFNYKTEITAN